MQRDDVIHQDWDIRQVSGGDWGDPDSFVFSGTPTIRSNDGGFASIKHVGGATNLTWMTDLGSVPVVFKTGIKLRNAIYDYDDTSDNYGYEYYGSLTNEELYRTVQSPTELYSEDTGATVSTNTESNIFYMTTPNKTR